MGACSQLETLPLSDLTHSYSYGREQAAQPPSRFVCAIFFLPHLLSAANTSPYQQELTRSVNKERFQVAIWQWLPYYLILRPEPQQMKIIMDPLACFPASPWGPGSVTGDLNGKVPIAFKRTKSDSGSVLRA